MNIVTKLVYNIQNPMSFFAEIQMLERKKEEKFQQIVNVKFNLEEMLHMLDNMNSVYGKFISNQPTYSFL